MAVFEKVRISLSRGAPPPLVEQAGPPEVYRSRQQFLREIFTQQHYFLRRVGKRRLSFLPIETPEGYVSGFFGREGTSTRRKGPDSLHEIVEDENWPVSLFVMDLAEDSQIAWLEHNSRVGSPKPLLEDFFSYLAQRSGFSDWKAHVEYITEEEEYWSVIKRYRRIITSLSFTFIPPNALKAEDTVMDFIRAATQQGNPDTITHTYKGDPGQMDPEGDVLKASAKIAMDGGGKAGVRAGRAQLYSSRWSRTRTEISDEEMPTPSQPGFVRRVIDRLFGR